MRDLGDSYVKEEFKLHKTAKPEFLEPFFREWDLYVARLNEQTKSTGFGAALGKDINTLTDEQRAMLAKLASETK
eukprot:CAMPEP_0171648146 /NCGR_PEP_ID=MMETSP0990-20121206/35928_1 /TAXON_ID=483369 /ORGANISM="non described non described, Strain CCMP2098" /LENGTH=74 /DNA_ID=CAMNT_0012225605 /DNA_START=124 /DNA_END=348 /DNA_ORIENTATION=-